MSEIPHYYLYRDGLVVYQGNDGYAVDELVRICDVLTMPCGVNVTSMGNYEGSADDHESDDISVGSRTESDDEHGEDEWPGF